MTGDPSVANFPIRASANVLSIMTDGLVCLLAITEHGRYRKPTLGLGRLDPKNELPLSGSLGSPVLSKDRNDIKETRSSLERQVFASTAESEGPSGGLLMFLCFCYRNAFGDLCILSSVCFR